MIRVNLQPVDEYTPIRVYLFSYSLRANLNAHQPGVAYDPGSKNHFETSLTWPSIGVRRLEARRES